jgi:broad specificity phosphatase PhoE
MEIYLVRHGHSTGNGGNQIMGWTDHPLTEVGQAQARAVAARLAPLGPMPVICSDLQRA